VVAAARPSAAARLVAAALLLAGLAVFVRPLGDAANIAAAPGAVAHRHQRRAWRRPRAPASPDGPCPCVVPMA
jgi:hypothetical protein